MNTEQEIDFKKVRKYAIGCHAQTNHRYDGRPYHVHLEIVYNFGMKYADLYFEEPLHSAVLAACYTHDLIEDCRQTYNDVRKVCGGMVAEITYALTNEKGRNRAERANKKYYAGIRLTPGALFVKLCDRLANAKYSVDNNSPMAELYRKEMHDFNLHLFDSFYHEMFKELSDILDRKSKTP